MTLIIRTLADKSGGVEKYNHETGQSELVNPRGGPWPSAGVVLEGDTEEIEISHRLVSQKVAAGVIVLVGERVVTCPAGPSGDPDRRKHTFCQADEIVFRCVGGDVHYTVTRSPGKYVISTGELATAEDVAAGKPCEVFWTFKAKRQ